MESIEVKKLKDELAKANKDLDEALESTDYDTKYQRVGHLRATIKYLESKIRQVEKEESLGERGKEYGFTVGFDDEKTKNPALAARYDAQHRMLGMGKMKRTMATITGQKRKFEKLWKKAALTTDREEQEKMAEKFEKMFR